MHDKSMKDIYSVGFMNTQKHTQIVHVSLAVGMSELLKKKKETASCYEYLGSKSSKKTSFSLDIYLLLTSLSLFSHFLCLSQKVLSLVGLNLVTLCLSQTLFLFLFHFSTQFLQTIRTLFKRLRWSVGWVTLHKWGRERERVEDDNGEEGMMKMTGRENDARG